MPYSCEGNMTHIIFFVTLLVISLTTTDARTHPGFSQDRACPAPNTEWMSTLDDARLLRHLSVPGTHDSLALYGGEQWQCQSMSLAEQLRAGIRALDVRCRHVNNTFRIYHQFVDQQVSFAEVLQTARAFLTAHPRETILMRIKKEWISEGNDLSFEKTFRKQFLEPNSDLFWTPTADPMNVRLGDVRGKIVILQNFSPKFSLLDHMQMKVEKEYGLSWDKDLDIQDDFTLLTTWAVYAKWIKVRDHLLRSNSTYLAEPSPDSYPKLFINFLSGSVGVKPYFVASGNTKWGTESDAHFFGLINMVKKGYKYVDFPKQKCYLGGRYCAVNFEGTNALVYNLLTSGRQSFKFVGIVYADFPGCGLIQSIIDVNEHF